MKNWIIYLGIVILSLSSLLLTTSAAQESRPSIDIDKEGGIVRNQYIKGHVYGIGASQCNQYKVVVYVRTDKWYIHPYATGGEGRSYATIESDGKDGGTWRILTVRREFGAYEVAALIVKKDYKPPATTGNIESIIHEGNVYIRNTSYKDGDKDWDL